MLAPGARTPTGKDRSSHICTSPRKEGVTPILIPFLWWFGVHGATVVGSVSGTIATANLQTNQAIFDQLTGSGMSRAEAIAALPANGGQIYASAFNNCFGAITGSGITMGLVIFMLFFAKSAQFKQVGKLGFIPYTIGVDVPWTTPPVLSGLTCIGWQAALWQIIEIAASFFIYLPFARAVDNAAYEQEQGEAQA